jgi:hypothetical protein
MLGLLQNSSSEVAGAAAVALMMLTLAKEGKVAMHQVSLTYFWDLKHTGQ